VNANDTAVADMVAFYRDVLGSLTRHVPRSPASTATGTSSADSQLHLVGAPAAGKRIDTTGHHYCVASTTSTRPSPSSRKRGIEYTAGAGRGCRADLDRDPAGNTIELQQENHTRWFHSLRPSRAQRPSIGLGRI